MKYDLYHHGVTQGLLTMWKTCRQMARLFLQGWSLRSTSMGLVYGTLYHAVLEKAYKDIQAGKLKTIPSQKLIQRYLKEVEKLWELDHPRADKKALEFKEKSLMLAEVTLPLYFDYWRKDFKEKKWQSVEEQFSFKPSTPVSFPIRGKIDGSYRSRAGSLWLFETKCKSMINEENLTDAISIDFQSFLYMWILWKTTKTMPRGFLFNIVRRIGLEQKQKESIKAFMDRCVKHIENDPEHYFKRFEIITTKAEMLAFESELYGTLLEFEKWYNGEAYHFRNTSQCETKYGRCNYLHICAGENFGPYEKRKLIFRELEDF